jgi:hypothetical protein
VFCLGDGFLSRLLLYCLQLFDLLLPYHLVLPHLLCCLFYMLDQGLHFSLDLAQFSIQFIHSHSLMLQLLFTVFQLLLVFTFLPLAHITANLPNQLLNSLILPLNKLQFLKHFLILTVVSGEMFHGQQLFFERVYRQLPVVD